MQRSNSLGDFHRRKKHAAEDPLPCQDVSKNPDFLNSSPDRVGEEKNENPLPDCNNTNFDPQIIINHTNDYVRDCNFGRWKNHGEKGSNYVFRKAKNKIYLANIKPSGSQPDKIYFILYGNLYEVLKVSPLRSQVRNLLKERAVSISSIRQVYQVEVKQLPPTAKQLSIF